MILNKATAAGIIIYRKQNNKIEFLGLAALPHFQKKSNGVYDVPKGHVNPGEDPFSCAKRECFEESGLIPDKIDIGPLKCDRLWLWLAECNGNPKIGINPHTGLQEHLGYAWLSPDDMESTCLDYLKSGIQWARKLLNV